MPSSDPKSLVLWCLAAFFCGSIPFGLLLVKLAGKGDVRAHGSGNIGATNVSRVGGKGLGVVTLLLDILKGFLPVFLAKRAGLGTDMLALLALAAVLGHIYTPWLKFQGGKGVATALGVILAAEPTLMVLPMVTFLFVLWLTRHVSLGSILAAAMVPGQFMLLAFSFFRPGWGVVVPWLALAILVIWKHRENIKRLQEGTEAKLWGGKKEDSHVQG
ncbi:glycerol-3-phosphate acyltransferase [Geothrix oryzae]|uniref:Glycerol-3-phosphate acyltransferase n=1 Tax=Geothrix oryzae TaxID=2927975 RepID=A0ABM8DQJ7_9BACT|nr:glycerol-3-phosphate 1-O-acyltransferase PlsY [Geothrix oryzae]BDU69246.1 glycerol-3-phosphate acyltransferase [Geothrix oryzae]